MSEGSNSRQKRTGEYQEGFVVFTPTHYFHHLGNGNFRDFIRAPIVTELVSKTRRKGKTDLVSSVLVKSSELRYTGTEVIFLYYPKGSTLQLSNDKVSQEIFCASHVAPILPASF